MLLVSLSSDQHVRLKEALMAAFDTHDAMREFFLANLDRSFDHYVRPNAAFTQNVAAMINDSASEGWVVQLVTQAYACVPVERFDRLARELSRVAPPPNVDHFDVCRLTGGFVMVDRDPLRASLRSLVDPQGKRILIVRGDEKSGKSHTIQFISYLSDVLGAFSFVPIDLAAYSRLGGAAAVIDPKTLADRLVRRLRYGVTLDDPPDNAQWSNWVFAFCEEFQTFAEQDKMRRWLVIDAFNRVVLSQPTDDLVKELAIRVSQGLPRFRLVLLGYQGLLPLSVLPHVEVEEISHLGHEHLLQFFKRAFQQYRIPFDDDDGQLLDSIERAAGDLDPDDPDFLRKLTDGASAELARVLKERDLP